MSMLNLNFQRINFRDHLIMGSQETDTKTAYEVKRLH